MDRRTNSLSNFLQETKLNGTTSPNNKQATSRKKLEGFLKQNHESLVECALGKDLYMKVKEVKSQANLKTMQTDESVESLILPNVEAQRVAQLRNLPRKSNLPVEILRISKKSSLGYRTNISDIKNDLKNEFYTIRRTAPERADVQALEIWIQEMKKQALAKNQQLTFLDYYADLASIYSGALSELNRMIHNHSKDHAKLIQKIWDENLELVVSQLKKADLLAKEVDIQGMSEVSRLHETYQKFIEKVKSYQDQQKEREETKNKDIELLKRENVYLRRKDIRRDQEQQKLMKTNDNYQSKINDLEKEISRLQSLNIQLEQYLQDEDSMKQSTKLPFRTISSVQMVQIEKENPVTQQLRMNHVKDIEEEEQFRQISQHFIPHMETVLFKNQQTDTHDLIKQCAKQIDTRELFTQHDQEVQAVVEKTYKAQFTQYQWRTENRETQVEFKVVEKLSTHDQNSENKDYQTLLSMANTKSMTGIINDLTKPLFPQNLHFKEIKKINQQSSEQYSIMQKNLESLFLMISLREQMRQDDIQAVREYLSLQINLTQDFQTRIWDIIQQFKNHQTDERIKNYELSIDNEILVEKLNHNIILYKSLHERYIEQRRQIHELQHMNKLLAKYQTRQNIVHLRGISQPSLVSGTQSPLKSKPESSPGQIIMKTTQLKGFQSDDCDDETLTPMIKPNNINPSIEEEVQLSSNVSESDSERSELSVQNLKLELNIISPTSNFEKKFRSGKIASKHGDVATSLMKGVMQKNSVKGLLSDKTLQKFLSANLLNYIKKLQSLNLSPSVLPFYVFIYESIHNSGTNFAPIVAVKFQRYIKSILVNIRKSSRLELFSLFLSGDYDNLDFIFYMKVMAFFDETNQKGVGLFQGNNDEYLRCQCPKSIQTIGKVLGCTDQHVNAETFYKIDQLKVMDSENNNKYFVDFDLMASILLKAYQEVRKIQQQEVVDIFYAVDCDKKSFIDLEQFILMMGLDNKTSYTKALRLFHSESDYKENTIRIMSLKRFMIICDEHKLLSESKIEEIKLDQWNDMKRDLKLAFIKAQKYTPLIRKICNQIDQSASGTDKKSSKRQINIMIQLLRQSSQSRILEEAISTYGVPQEFNLINQAFLSSSS